MRARRHQLEAVLEARGLGATLRRGTSAPGAFFADPGEDVAETGLARLLQCGAARGAITEIVAFSGGGLTSLACRLAAVHSMIDLGDAARVAWLDPCDTWDPDSARRAGVRLDQVLWLRGESETAARRGGTETPLKALARWHRALNLLVAAGGMDLIVADFSTWPVHALRRTPRSAWFRLVRGLERTRKTALVVLAPEPLASTAAALTLEVTRERARFSPGWARLQAVGLEGRLRRGRDGRSRAALRGGPSMELQP